MPLSFPSDRRYFDGPIEVQNAPRLFTGLEICDRVCDITNVFGRANTIKEKWVQMNKMNEMKFNLAY